MHAAALSGLGYGMQQLSYRLLKQTLHFLVTASL